MRVPVARIAHGRSGDKGDTANIGLLAFRPDQYDVLLREVTAERVREHLRHIVKGTVTRYELPNIHALNFVLTQALDGGGTLSLRIDAQGKTLSTALLRMEIEVNENEL
ncbi:MAG TPA: hypothetical protein VES20_02920 [Bryobacteraceae bacterium]|nr:hypothetical protein [Bryobacteraceae bacterium]